MASLLGRQVASSADILLFELKTMLRREEELRAFRRYRKAGRRYRKAGRGPEGMSVVPLAVQLRVAEEFGVPPDICLEALRCAPALLFPDDAEVPTLSFYRRFNRCRDRSLAVGDSAPNVKLHPCRRQAGPRPRGGQLYLTPLQAPAAPLRRARGEVVPQGALRLRAGLHN